MKPGVLCVLLLSGCLTTEGPYQVSDYALTWTCLSPEGCERVADVMRIDRMERRRPDCVFTSTLDQTFSEEATVVVSYLLPDHCSWLYFLSVFGQELERAKMCFGPATFELELAIPNQDPTTFSMWLVEGRDVNLL